MIKKTIIILLQGYKKYLSPFLGNNYRCRFYPTCSEYAVDAVEQHGVLCGSGLVLKRLLRCHPWHKKAGYDPVPEALVSDTNKKEAGEKICGVGVRHHK